MNIGPNAPEGVNGLQERFMAGILKHMRALSAFTLPNATSYDRLQDGCWSGVYVAWGIDNRFEINSDFNRWDVQFGLFLYQQGSDFTIGIRSGLQFERATV